MKKSDMCNECNGILKEGKFEIYCKNCGLITEDSPINFGKEGYMGDPEKAARKRRTGPPITWINPDWGTTFDLRKWNNRKR